MSTTSPLLRLTLQELDENPDTWGDVINVSALRLLEDGIAGAAAVSLLSTADFVLDDTAGGPTLSNGARYAILAITGTPGGATNVVVPTRSKIYLASNQSDASVVVKTAAGTGPTIIAGEAQWVFCDGTNVIAASAATAVTAGTATNAADSALLNGIASTAFAQKAEAQTFTRGQVTQRTAVTLDAGDLDIDCSLSNAFYHLTTAPLNLTAPTAATNGQQFSLVIEQGVGAPHGISFQAGTFMFEGGSVPTLSTTFAAVDYLAFEYVTNLNNIGAPRWIGSIIKGVETV